MHDERVQIVGQTLGGGREAELVEILSTASRNSADSAENAPSIVLLARRRRSSASCTSRRSARRSSSSEEIDHETQTIYLHETIDRYGRLMRGLKGSHHVGDREKRSRWTLFPVQLGDLDAAIRSTRSSPIRSSPKVLSAGFMLSFRNATVDGATSY